MRKKVQVNVCPLRAHTHMLVHLHTYVYAIRTHTHTYTNPQSVRKLLENIKLTNKHVIRIPEDIRQKRFFF